MTSPTNRSEQITALYKEGKGQREIARIVGISQPGVRKCLLKLGLLKSDNQGAGGQQRTVQATTTVDPSTREGVTSLDNSQPEVVEKTRDQVVENSTISSTRPTIDSLKKVESEMVLPADTSTNLNTETVHDNLVFPGILDGTAGTLRQRDNFEVPQCSVTDNPVVAIPDSHQTPAPVPRRIPTGVRPCKWCHELFVLKYLEQRYCCNACGHRANRLHPVVPHSKDCLRLNLKTTDNQVSPS